MYLSQVGHFVLILGILLLKERKRGTNLIERRDCESTVEKAFRYTAAVSSTVPLYLFDFRE